MAVVRSGVLILAQVMYKSLELAFRTGTGAGVCVCVCVCVCGVCVCVCVVSVIVKRPVLPPCAVDGRSRNPLYYYYYYYT